MIKKNTLYSEYVFFKLYVYRKSVTTFTYDFDFNHRLHEEQVSNLLMSFLHIINMDTGEIL